MRAVDEIMTRCPLKQFIRSELWKEYAARAVRNFPIKRYLTLYSPPMMDIKYFGEEGLLDFDSEHYPGVVAITYDGKAYAEAIRRSKGRPRLILLGDINNLITGDKSNRKDHRLLLSYFPFEVVNLDYTKSIYYPNKSHRISHYLKAFKSILKHQQRKGIGKFALFLTTRGELGQLSAAFLSDLERRLNNNMADSVAFKSAFNSAYKTINPRILLTNDYDEFAPVGIVKLIAEIAAEYGFEIDDCDAIWLIRDLRPPVEGLLHLAFLLRSVQRRRSSRLEDYGKHEYEKRVRYFIRKRIAVPVKKLAESNDKSRLESIHGSLIKEMAEDNFEIRHPMPD